MLASLSVATILVVGLAALLDLALVRAKDRHHRRALERADRRRWPLRVASRALADLGRDRSRRKDWILTVGAGGLMAGIWLLYLGWLLLLALAYLAVKLVPLLLP